MYVFVPSGVCAKEIHFDVENGELHGLKFVGGCPGSLEAITRLLEGKDLATVIENMKGIVCGKKDTSCPDQLTQVLQDILDGNGDKHKKSAMGGLGAGGLQPMGINPFN